MHVIGMLLHVTVISHTNYLIIKAVLTMRFVAQLHNKDFLVMNVETNLILAKHFFYLISAPLRLK